MIEREPAALERRFLVMVCTRWLPVGLTFGLSVLLPLDRGVRLPEIGVLLAIRGFVVLALELPSGALADAVGRRPVLIAAALTAVGSTLLFATATSFWVFAAAIALQGVFRALDSGPLEAWFVDALGDAATPKLVGRALGHASTALGGSIAAGAAIGGVLVASAPSFGLYPFGPPFALAIIVSVAHLVLTTALVRESRPAAAPADLRSLAPRQGQRLLAPLRDGLIQLTRHRVLRNIVLVEVFWAAAIVGFETLTPVRLAELSDGADAAAAIYGPASAVGWGLFALGSTAVGRLSSRFRLVTLAVASRVLNGLFVALMGVAAGVSGLLAAYALTYLTHGGGGPAHNALLHLRATSANRATVLSLNSMVAGGSFSVLVLGALPLAERVGTGTTLIILGAISTVGALLYLPGATRQPHE